MLIIELIISEKRKNTLKNNGKHVNSNKNEQYKLWKMEKSKKNRQNT